MEVEGDSLISREFIGEDIPSSASARDKIRQQALAHKDYPAFLVSSDSVYGGIFIRTDFGIIPLENSDQNQLNVAQFKPTEMKEYAELMRAINQIITTADMADQLEFYPVGNPVIMSFFNDVISIEMEQILDIAVLIMLVILGVIFRSFAAALWSLAVIVVSILLTLGFMAWVGMDMDIMTTILLMLILIISIADTVHILSGYTFFRRNGRDHEQALNAVFSKSGFACLLTSVTTSLGLASLIFVNIPPVRNFGIAGAVGVMITFLVAMVLLPSLMDIWSPISKKQLLKLKEKPKASTVTQKFLKNIEPYSSAHPRLILAIFLVVGVVAAYGVSKVNVDSNLVEAVKEGSPLRIAHELVDQQMGGSQSMEIFLEFSTEDALKDPAVLNLMEKMEALLRSDYPQFVVKTDSLVNIVKNTFQVLNENRVEMYKIPQDRPALEQTLLLFENGNREDRQLVATDDFRKGRISVRLYNYGSMEYLQFFSDVEKQMKQVFAPLKNKYPDMQVQVTGGLALIMGFADNISWSQIKSFLLALAVISALLMVIFGSLKLGLIAILPNTLPVLTTFGVMGYLDIPLDGDTLIIAPIIIGIVVDDTIHFLTHYKSSLLETGDIAQSISLSLKEAGQAIVFSTIIMVLGFSVLIGSSHNGLSHFGFLLGVAFCTALLADLILLPALCVLFKAEGKSLLSTEKAALAS